MKFITSIEHGVVLLKCSRYSLFLLSKTYFLFRVDRLPKQPNGPPLMHLGNVGAPSGSIPSNREMVFSQSQLVR